MKNSKFLVGLFFIIASLTFTSCENEPIDSALNLDDFGNGNGANNGSFKVDIDGVTFTATNVIATKVSVPFAVYQIAGTAVSGGVVKSVMIQIIDNGTNSYLTGTNADGPEDAMISYFPNASNENEIYASDDFDDIDNSTGSLTMTANDIVNRKISGNFSCTVYLINEVDGSVIGSKSLSNGIFTNVTYTLTN